MTAERRGREDQRARFMRLALREAKKGLGRTSPNPAVGAVVVSEQGEVVATGFHARAGGPHAEVVALTRAGEAARGATLYVTLEPCNHTGRTGPCTQAILAAGVRRVVIGMADPNPHVAGGGAAFLAGCGVEVEEGVLAEECAAINRPFVKHITTGRPWVLLKAGMSLDGKLAAASGHSAWITNEAARREVHRLRGRSDAILVGRSTAVADDPALTCRLRRGRDPIRVVLDSRLQLPPTARMLCQDSTAPTWVLCTPQAPSAAEARLVEAGAEVFRLPADRDGRLDLAAVLDFLGQRQVTSLLVEGGGEVHTAFLRAGLADECALFIAPLLLGADGLAFWRGTGALRVEEGLRLTEVAFRRFGDNILVRGRPLPAS